MGKGNGKTESTHLDLDRELPPAEGGDDTAPATPLQGGTPAVSEAEKLRVERDALLDRLARLQAEFDNARKRATREQQEFREFAATDVIKNILPVLDSFERALKAPAGSAGSNSNDLRSGLELIYRQFQDALQKLGVQPIEAVGKQFDPRLHEAVEMVDTTDAEDHQVLDEFQRGYNYKGRLLRPAMVRVAKNGA
ncbi:MAG TPA: nucleotide exchange factor GrpE [Terriglobales bacterium]|jgi:molecular chaperone GrpE|nr:nucleotide exchange factor GrpE [Terriglobales bacterium]